MKGARLPKLRVGIQQVAPASCRLSRGRLALGGRRWGRPSSITAAGTAALPRVQNGPVLVRAGANVAVSCALCALWFLPATYALPPHLIC